MRIFLGCVGRLKAGPEQELCSDYLARASALGPGLGLTGFHLTEVEEKNKSAGLKEREAAKLLAAIPETALIVALDERGSCMGSEKFADWIGRERDSGTADMAFLIGGADGLSPQIRERAAKTLAFGPQTWPHMLARVMLTEQLYRAVTILAGHPYHRP